LDVFFWEIYLIGLAHYLITQNGQLLLPHVMMQLNHNDLFANLVNWLFQSGYLLHEQEKIKVKINSKEKLVSLGFEMYMKRKQVYKTIDCFGPMLFCF